MLHKIKTLVLSLTLALTALAPVALPSAVSAEVTGQVTGGVCQGASTLKVSDSVSSNSCTAADQQSTVDNLISKILNIFSVVVGLAAVIMIVIAGFKYITSGGKEEGVKSAKNTILYAVIGLVVVALAQVIVQFVLKKSTTI